MMGIERIKRKILEEAQDQKKAILEEAKSRAQDIAAKSEKKAEEIRQATAERYKRIGEEEQRKILSMTQLELRKSFLTEKQALIDEVFVKAEERLGQLSEETYQKLISSMLIKAAITGDEEVIISPEDTKKITPELISKANDELRKNGKAGNLQLSAETREMIGGFVLRSQDVEINNTFDALIKLEREELETEIAKILFEE